MAANKIVKTNAYTSKWDARLGKNSAAFAVWDLVSNVWGIATPATTTWRIDWIANWSVTFASDNQTVAQAKLGYTVAIPNLTEIEIDITWGTITVADEGKYFLLTDANTVDGTSESATPTLMQLKLVKFVSATRSIFTTIETEIIV